VQGEADEYGTLAQVEAIARRVPSEIFIVPGAGHSPHRTHPAEVHERIAQFIRAQSARSG
jgi:pimeloyl-ACP methyl ester carboxylesterase